MPRTETFSCYICGEAKQQTNNWFVHLTGKPGLALNTWEWAESEGVLRDEATEYICGHGCTHKVLDAYLQHETGKGE